AADTIRIEVDAAALGGLGAGLAAALLAWLGVRRRAQRRTRPPGMRIAAPSGPAAALERRLRAGADPDEQPGVEAVLRRIGGAAARAGGRPPALSVVRVQDGEHGLYFMAPTELPEPFEPIAEDGSAWRIARPPEPREDDPPNAPYPALVRLGEDEAGGRLLVDLEQIGALSLEGPEPELHRVLAALALELASSPGAATATVTLLGLPPDLAARLETGRLRCAEDPGQLLRQLRGRLGSARQALDSLGLSEVREARLGEEAGAWGPEVVLLGRAPEPETGEALVRAALAAPGGVALVGPGLPGARWRLRVFDAHRASLELPGGSGSIPLRPQRLDEAERERLAGLVDAAFAPPEEGPAWAAALREARSPDPAAPQPAAPPPPARHPEEHAPAEHEPEERRPEEPEADEPEPEGPQAERREAARPGAAERPAAPAGRRSRDAQREPLDPEARALVDGLARRPWVRLLGPVELHNAAGEAPRSPQGEALNRSTMNRAAELIAFLALHPGANAVQVHAALWPGRDPHGKAAASSRNGLVSRARRWLGHAPDGEMHFPHIGAAGYRLHEAVTTDWQLFEQLVGEDVGRTPTARLLAALDLVRGAPITAVKDRYYAWAELLRMDMLAGIADVCHELVRRSLGSGDVAGARAAAALARQVDPVNESAWRDALLAEIRAGDAAGFERIVSRLERTLDELELDEEPEPETRALIEEGRRRLARGAA
ncbi:MAG: hypothetical protein Q4E05_03375, partial [Pseudoclavibacter sp.]|nr:hypothetical protein [Pseudoclavibacter sp.]